jgi:hypothetical protein
MYRLGNMALLQKRPNGRIGNKPWSDKKPVLAASKLVLTRQAGREPDWTKGVIDKRQQHFASLAVSTWPPEPDEGHIPPKAAAWVDHIRDKSNDANHEINLMGREDAEQLIKFSEMLLRIMYEYPAEVADQTRSPV